MMIRQLLPSSIFRKILMALILTSVEAFLSILCLLSGIPILINPGTLAPGSVLALLPGWTIYLWALSITAGGALSLVGIALNEYGLERIGVLLLMTVTAVFALALVGFLPTTFLALVTFALFSLAMAARFWVLGKLLQIEKMQRDHIRENANGAD